MIQVSNNLRKSLEEQAAVLRFSCNTIPACVLHSIVYSEGSSAILSRLCALLQFKDLARFNYLVAQ